MPLTHFNDSGKAKMVDVTEKNETSREAIAEGRIQMRKETLQIIKSGEVGKGDVLAVAQVAGIMGAKTTWQLIPMCHPILLTGVNIEFCLDETNNAIIITAMVKTTGKTGVEMEALAAVSTAALTIYDMCKAIDKNMVIENIRLLKKTGGKSDYFRNSATGERM